MGQPLLDYHGRANHPAAIQGAVSFDYSIDNKFTSSGMSVSEMPCVTGVLSAAGNHTIHFTSWLKRWAICPVVSKHVHDRRSPSVAVETSTGSAIVSVTQRCRCRGTWDGLSSWATVHDTGTPGSSTAPWSIPDKETFILTMRASLQTIKWRRSELSRSFDNNPSSLGISRLIPSYVTVPSQLQNLELDLNQVNAKAQKHMSNTPVLPRFEDLEYTVDLPMAQTTTAANVPCNTFDWAGKLRGINSVGYNRG